MFISKDFAPQTMRMSS